MAYPCHYDDHDYFYNYYYYYYYYHYTCYYYYYYWVNPPFSCSPRRYRL